VHLRASTLVRWKHEACVPRARNNIVRHSAVIDITVVESTAVTFLSRELDLSRRQPVILCLDSVDDIVVDDYLLTIYVCVDAPCDDVMDDIAIEGHIFRVGDLDTQAQARRNSGIRHTLDLTKFSGFMELNRCLIGFL